MEDLKNQIINKAGFLVYTDYWEKYFSKMTGEQIKETLKIVFHFAKTFEILQTNDLAVEMVIATWIDNIKRDAIKRTKQAEASKENGKLGGRPKGKQKVENLADSESKKESELKILKNNFEEFWQFYTPTTGKDGTFVSKGSKADASRAYDKAIKQFSHDKIMECLKFYLTSCHKNSRFTKHASSWLNQSLKDNFEIEESVAIQSQPQPTKLTRDQQQDLINQQLEEKYAFNQNF